MTKLEEIRAILRGPGAMCRMSDAEADDVAREIVAALREPSEAMIKAADAEAVRVFGNAHEQLAPFGTWLFMIDSILTEADEG